MEDIFFISLNPSKAFLRSANNWFEICCAGVWKNSWRTFQRFRETISHSHTVGSINEQKFALLPSVIRISILPSDSCCQPLIPLDRSFPTILYRICVYITLISNRSRRVHQASPKKIRIHFVAKFANFATVFVNFVQRNERLHGFGKSVTRWRADSNISKNMRWKKREEGGEWLKPSKNLDIDILKRTEITTVCIKSVSQYPLMCVGCHNARKQKTRKCNI